MNIQEAIEKGFHYTGMSWHRWDAKDEEYCKGRAKALKKAYGGVDYRIVTENNHWKSIYGNNVFQKVQHYDIERAKSYLDDYPNRVKKLKEEYENKLKRLEEEFKSASDKYNDIMAIKVG